MVYLLVVLFNAHGIDVLPSNIQGVFMHVYCCALILFCDNADIIIGEIHDWGMHCYSNQLIIYIPTLLSISY